MKSQITKTRTVGYWVATGLLAFFLLSGGVANLFQMSWQVEGMIHLGYPVYFMSILGLWKILGTVAILTPRFPLIKEWAYAGIFFDLTGAVVSHAVSGDGFWHSFWPLLITGLAIVSWYLRPESRKLIRISPNF